MSIEADATAIVEKDGHTHIIRARPSPAEQNDPMGRRACRGKKDREEKTVE